MANKTLTVATKKAQCPECGARHWFIHSENGGMGIRTCRTPGCGYEAPIITELELLQGIPVDPYARGRLKELRFITGKIEKHGNGGSHDKSAIYLERQEEIIADWHKGGRDLVMKNWPIALSTLRQKEKLWELVPSTDRRATNYFKPKRTNGETECEPINP